MVEHPERKKKHIHKNTFKIGIGVFLPHNFGVLSVYIKNCRFQKKKRKKYFWTLESQKFEWTLHIFNLVSHSKNNSIKYFSCIFAKLEHFFAKWK